MKEIENVLRIFKETKRSIENNAYGNLKSLSDQTINTASLTQDPDNIAVAVIVYSLGKIFIREEYKKSKDWKKFSKKIINSIQEIINYLDDNEEEKARKEIQNVRSLIENISDNLKDYIQEVFTKASINKASRIYEHGISMEQTANLLGITMYDLASYAGERRELSELPKIKISAQSRIKTAMEFFE